MNLIERKIIFQITRQLTGHHQSKCNNNNKNISYLPTIITVNSKSSYCGSLNNSNNSNNNNNNNNNNKPQLQLQSIIMSKLRNASSIAVPATVPSPSITTQQTTATTNTIKRSSSITQEIISDDDSVQIIIKNAKNHQNKNLNILNDDKKILPFENIPAAKGLPIFGTHLDFIAAGSAQQLHKYIHKRHEQLGPIFREKLGGTQDAVFVASPDLMRTVFNYEGQYPMHPLPESWNIYNKKHNCRRGLFFMNGPEWLQNRRIMNKFLLNGNCNWVNQHIYKSTNNLIEVWKKKCRNQENSSSFLDLNDLEVQLYRWSIDVLTSIMFGVSISDSSSKDLLNEIDIFSKNVYKIFESSSSLMSFPPKLAEILKLKIWTDFETNVTDVLDMGNKIVDKCISEFGHGNGLLAKMVECEMSYDDVKRIFVDLIIAAGDTTAYSTQWALYLLTKSKYVQETARNEIKCLKFNEESQYIKGLIKETLRLYPVAPFIGRFLACDVNVGNYQIDKNTLVLLSLYTSGRDEKNFPDAMKVCPERWFRKSNGELMNVLHPTASIPFAMGIRSCIGKKIALNQMYSLISQMVSNFEIVCLNDSDVDVILRMVAVPNQPIRLIIRKL